MHVHSHVPLEQVPKELSKYDLGINVVTHLVTGNSNYRHSKNFQNILTCGSARNTDYLDACLPIITSPEVAFQFHKLKKRGVRIELTRELLENPREVLEPFVSPDVRELVRQRRAGYTIQAHSERLVRFYERCLDNY